MELLRLTVSAIPAVVILLGLALLVGERLNRTISALAKPFTTLARNPVKCYLLVGMTTLVVLLVSTFLTGIPLPGVHDEFSYLLAGDTFAHGRLTNPTPAEWKHFETFHVLMQPSYMSKYPPGQGAFLAIGQLIWHPILGVWLSAILASLAVYGMLRRWLSPIDSPWAVLGGLLFSVHPVILRWTHSYWGGCVAVFGGALLFGNAIYLLNLLEERKGDTASSSELRILSRHTLGMGLGIVVLANSRPFEGAIATISVLLALGKGLWRVSAPRDPKTTKAILLPLLLCLLGLGVMIGYYNARITGSPIALPYMVHERTYGAAPQLIWQAASPPVTYNHPHMERFYHNNDARQYYLLRTFSGFIHFNLDKMTNTLLGYYHPVLLLLLLLQLPFLLKLAPNSRLAVLIIGVCLFGFLFEKSQFIHYTAPLMPLFLYLVYRSFQHLSTWRWREKAIGKPFVFFTLIAYMGFCGSTLYNLPVAETEPFPLRRSMILQELKAKGGQHLILVHYTAKHEVNWEWVYNEADIENAPVVWAIDMGGEANRGLLEQFHNRQIWYFNADDYHWELVPFTPTNSKASTTP